MTAASDIVVVDCVEYGYIDIDPDLWISQEHRTKFYSEIDGRDILRATFRNGVLKLQATSYVGVIPLNERVVIRVRPRVPIANLTRMVIDTGHDVLPLSAFRDYSGRGTADDWALDIYTDALLGYVEEILDAGMMRAYERRNGEGHFPRGNISFTQTIQRFGARGVSNKAAYSWFDRSVDIPANRCIKAALEVVHDHLARNRSKPRKGDRSKALQLAGQLHAFNDVSDDPDHSFFNDAHVIGNIPLPDSRAYYRPVLDLSLLILQNVGLALELGGSDVRLSSLLIDTNKLFENFVRASLVNHASQSGWQVQVLDGNGDGKVDLYDIPVPLPAPLGNPLHPLAARDPGKAQPDIVIRDLDGKVVLIAEVKNTVHGVKAGIDTLPDRGEVEQAVTYALRYGLDYALLVHPWTAGSKGLVYVGRVKTVDLYDYRLDLSLADGTDNALADMAAVVARLAGIAP